MIPIRRYSASDSPTIARLKARTQITKIARIVGIPLQAEAGLRGLIASGAVSWSGGKPEPRVPLEMAPRGTQVSQMVLEDRR